MKVAGHNPILSYGNCWSCGTNLVPKENATPEQIEKGKYASREHIIPKSMGGHLRSMKLLCVKCNNEFGVTIDADMEGQLTIHKLIKYKREDRINDKKSVGTDADGKEYIVSSGLGKYKYSKPIFKENSALFNNQEEADGFRKKRWEEGKKYSSQEIQLPPPVIYFTFSISSDNLYKGILKIAINYYMYSQGKVEYLSPAINALNGNNRSYYDFVGFYFASGIAQNPYEPQGDEISHIIHLQADRRSNLLYAYIELFSTYCFLVVLNDNYIGENFESQTYVWDIMGANEISNKHNVQISLFRNLFINLHNWNYTQIAEKMYQKRLERIMGIIEKMQHE